MKQKERVGINLLKRLKNDYIFRTFIFSALSFFITLAFTIYNTFLGFAYKAVWNTGIAIYYALLLFIRAYVMFSERKFFKEKLNAEQLENKRKKLFLVQSIMLFIIDFALIAPVSIMVLQKKAVEYSSIPAIAAAAYTTYKIIVSTKNIVKTRRMNHISVKILRTVGFVDALVSVLTLQYTLIMTFGGGMDKDMFVLCAVTSFGIWMALVILSVNLLLQAIRPKKQ